MVQLGLFRSFQPGDRVAYTNMAGIEPTKPGTITEVIPHPEGYCFDDGRPVQEPVYKVEFSRDSWGCAVASELQPA